MCIPVFKEHYAKIALERSKVCQYKCCKLLPKWHYSIVSEDILMKDNFVLSIFHLNIPRVGSVSVNTDICEFTMSVRGFHFSLLSIVTSKNLNSATSLITILSVVIGLHRGWDMRGLVTMNFVLFKFSVNLVHFIHKDILCNLEFISFAISSILWPCKKNVVSSG